MKDSQHRKIIDYLREYPGATVRELFIYCNVNSPTKRLSELRQMGMIEDRWDNRTRWDGSTVRFKRYYLKGANNEAL